MKREKRSITGVLLLDKPLGITSNAALLRAKILYNADKAGHTGTLDPFASGLLPVCFGEATKFAGFMLNADKTYEATIRLGRTTTTGDREGEVLTESVVVATPTAVTEALDRFTGPISQLPPMYSALKFQGQPLYRLARQGLTVPREVRQIFIRRLDLLAFTSPLLQLRILCSKGTYVRVLAEDIGKALGCGGMLEDLRRTGTGNFDLLHSLTLAQLEKMPLVIRDARLAPADCLVQHLPEIELEGGLGRSLQEGRSNLAGTDKLPGVYRAYARPRQFLGLVEVTGVGILQPHRMMSRSFAPTFESVILETAVDRSSS